MKIRSAILTEMSGKLGGAVGSTAKGGIQYLRKLVIPANPSTFLQTAIRAAVSSASAYWKSVLSEEQIQAWWDVAEGSQQGKTLFAKVNQPRIYAQNTGRVYTPAGVLTELSLPVKVLPPESFSAPGHAIDYTVDASANELTIGALPDDAEFSIGAAADNPAIMLVYASTGQVPSRLSRKNPYNLVAAVRFPAATDSFAGFDIDLAALGMPTIEGYVMYLKTVFISPGGGVSVPLEQRIELVP